MGPTDDESASGSFCLHSRVTTIGVESSPAPIVVARVLFVPGGSVPGGGVGDTSARRVAGGSVPRATGTPESKVTYGFVYCMRTYVCIRNHFGPVVTARLEPLFCRVLVHRI